MLLLGNRRLGQRHPVGPVDREIRHRMPMLAPLIISVLHPLNQRDATLIRNQQDELAIARGLDRPPAGLRVVGTRKPRLGDGRSNDRLQFVSGDDHLVGVQVGTCPIWQFSDLATDQRRSFPIVYAWLYCHYRQAPLTEKHVGEHSQRADRGDGGCEH